MFRKLMRVTSNSERFETFVRRGSLSGYKVQYVHIVDVIWTLAFVL